MSTDAVDNAGLTRDLVRDLVWYRPFAFVAGVCALPLRNRAPVVSEVLAGICQRLHPDGANTPQLARMEAYLRRWQCIDQSNKRG